MYDTVAITYYKSNHVKSNLLSEVSKYIDVKGEHSYGYYGYLSNLSISITKDTVRIKKGSLCKWFMGNNLYTMNIRDTRLAIESLSDNLHLPMHKANVYGIDFGTNLKMDLLPQIYLNHLGESVPYQRLAQSNGLYYLTRIKGKAFYDKIKEMKQKHEPIPPDFKNENYLRYEMRLRKRLKDTLNVSSITGASLYDETFYKKLIGLWRAYYYDIKKIKDISINFDMMKGKKDFNLMARLSFIQERGGEIPVLQDINEYYKIGSLTRRQADELKKAIRDTCMQNTKFIKENGIIVELDQKIDEACNLFL